MSIKINGLEADLVKLNGSALASLKYNSTEVWPTQRRPRLSIFVFDLPAENPTVDLWLTQSAAGAVTVITDDNTTLKSSQIKAEFPYTFTTGGRHVIGIEVADGETWNPGVNDGSLHNFVGGVEENGVFPEDETLTLAHFGYGVRLSDDIPGAFRSCTALTEVRFEESDLSIIGQAAFDNCTALDTIRWGSSVREIHQSAFGFTAFTELHIPASVNLVELWAFGFCRSLINLEVAASEIRASAFSDCTALEKIWLRSTVETVAGHGTGLFDALVQWTGCSPDATLYCEPASKPSGWNSEYDAYARDAEAYLRYNAVWGQTVPPWDVSKQPLNYSWDGSVLDFYETAGGEFAAWDYDDTDRELTLEDSE